MNLYHSNQKLNGDTSKQGTSLFSWKTHIVGLRQSEQEAYQLILEFIELEEMTELEKLNFLRAVEILSSAVRAQGNGDMNNYYSKTKLADKIETLILQESTENLISNVRQQAMLCIVSLSQVNPPFSLSQKLHLVNAAVHSVFSLPLIMPSPNRKESASLYMQTVQALDEMLQALVMDYMNPDMFLLQNYLEIILPGLTVSEKEHKQIRTLGTVSRLLRFICKFPELSNMMKFSVSGRLMGILGLFCLNSVQEIGTWASEALHYLFKILVLQRSLKHKTEIILKDLQKHFRGGWLASIQDLTMFFINYLTPEERADVILISMEALTSASRHDSCAASKMLKIILKDSIPEIGKVSTIIQYIYDNMDNITEITAQASVQNILYLLAQTYTDEVILTLFKIEDQSQKGFCNPWKMLTSLSQNYEVIMEHLLQRLTSAQRTDAQEPSQRTQISPLTATRAIYELLLEPSWRIEVQSFFPSLFMALLFQMSFLTVEKKVEFIEDQQHFSKWMNPISCTLEALKTLMHTSGYGSYVSEVRALGGWEMLTNPETHYDGITLLARIMVAKNCWHNCPIFSLIIQMLQEMECRNHLTVFVFTAELLWSKDVAAIVDDIAVHILANCFQSEEPAMVKLLLKVAEIFTKHGNMVRQLCILQPYLLNCCFSTHPDIVMKAFLVLKSLVECLTWKHSASFMVQLTFMLGLFFEKEADHLRFIAFELYGILLAKVKRKGFTFPLKHQVLNKVVLLVLHLKDVNGSVAQVCRSTLCHIATVLGWRRLKEVFAKRDVWAIATALLEQEAKKAPWFLRQCTALFKSPQASIRLVAVWFAGQIIQILKAEEANELEEVHADLQHMQKDPDSMVSCLATQTCYILEVRKKMQPGSTETCCCLRRPWRHYIRTSCQGRQHSDSWLESLNPALEMRVQPQDL